MLYFSEENYTKHLKLKCINLTIPDASKNTRKVGLSYIAHCWWTENDPATQLGKQFSSFSNNRSTPIARHPVTVCGYLSEKVKHTLT